ncbi:MAG: Crp/Fnr family transcriptional regulator [Tannerella sp.]|nr:Crp/Fnr family transcriptional regulator [Tannerella sp.]
MENCGLPIEEIGICNNRISYKTVAKNEFLVMPGNISGYTFFIERGMLRMYAIDEKGKEHTIQFAPEMWLLADRRSTYLKEPSKFYIQAVEESDVVYLERGFVEELVKMFPDVAEEITMLLHRHIMLGQHRIHQLLSASAEERYLDFLDTYPHLINRLPLCMIASHLGMTPESLSRVRSELSRAE